MMQDCMRNLMPNKKEWYTKFKVKPMPGQPEKGSAVSALRNLAKGEVILAESPLFTLPIERNHDAVMGALAACNSEYKRMFYAMVNMRTDNGMTDELGIFATNCIPCGTDYSSGRVASKEGVFVIGARMNHSCTPNVHGQWVDWCQQMEQRAVRDIQAKEELCRAYIDVLKPREERQRELMEKYWFKCKCEACNLTGEKLEGSDRRRQTIRQLLDKHSDGKCADALEGLQEIRRALDCIRVEGLTAFEAIFYFFGFHICAASSDYVNAVEWAKKARDASLLLFGGTLQEIYERLVANPRCYPDVDTMPQRTLYGPDTPSG